MFITSIETKTDNMVRPDTRTGIKFMQIFITVFRMRKNIPIVSKQCLVKWYFRTPLK